MNLDLLGTAASMLNGGGSSSGSDGGISGFTSLVGSALPIPFGSQIGSVVGSLFGKVGSLFKGHPFDAQGMFEGLHSPTLPKLDDSQFYKDDARIYVEWAKALGISVEEAYAVIQNDGRVNNYPGVLDAYRTQDGHADTGSKMQQFMYRLKEYNSTYPLAQIHPGEMGPRSAGDYNTYSVAQPVPLSTTMQSLQADLAGKGIGSTVIQSAPQSTANLSDSSTLIQQNAPTSTSNSFLGMSKDEINAVIKSGLGGAQKGLIDGVMNTGIGKQAQDSGANQWVSDHIWPIGLAGAGFGGLLIYLIATRK